MRPRSFSDKKPVLENRYVRFYSVLADFGEFQREYFVSERRTRAGVIVLDRDRVLLVKQYRYVIDDYTWELPSGGVDDGEDLEAAARRECLEETGVRCGELRPLFDFVLSPDVLDCPAYIYECSEFEGGGAFDRREIAAVRWVPLSECMGMINSREIKDPFTIIALLMFERSRRA